MSYTSEPADQIVRYSLEGTEVALKLTGTAAEHFAMFAYAILKDQKKTRGKTKLVRLLKEGKPLKFFTLPADRMREFAREAKRHGLLFVPMRDNAHPGVIEITVCAQDAAKVNRIMDRMCLDFVKAAAGDALPEQAPKTPTATPAKSAVKIETVETPDGTVDFVVGGFEDDFGLAGEDAGNFTKGRADAPLQRGLSPSAPSSPSKNFLQTPSAEDKDALPPRPGPGQPSGRPSVRQELREIRQEQANKAEHKKPERANPAQQRTRTKHKKNMKGR